MAITLRDYQIKLVEEARALLRAGKKSIMIQASTGSGKTAIGAHILQNATSKGAYTHFWVPKIEVLRQSVLAMDRADVECGIIAAGFPEKPSAPVQICSIQSLPRRIHRLRKPDLIIVDEAAHLPCRTWSKLIEAYPDAVKLFLTATPIRLSGEGFRQWIDEMIVGPPTAELIDMGWLSRYKIYTPKPLDLSDIHIKMGEFDKKELDKAMKGSTVSGDAVRHYQRDIPGEPAVCFTWSIESSLDLAARFNSAGISAAHIGGETPAKEREDVIKKFAAGEIKVISNVDLISEGYDCPSISGLFLLRPTQSLSWYLQAIGRGLRPSPGKDHVKIYDHAGNVSRHGFPDDPREWSLDGQKKKKRDASDGPMSRTCPKCLETSRLNVRICPCGYKLVMDREVEVDEAVELTELDPAIARRERLIEQGMADGLAELEELGRRKGHRYPKLWAAHVYKAREQKKLAAARTKQLAAAATQTAASTRDAWEF